MCSVSFLSISGDDGEQLLPRLLLSASLSLSPWVSKRSELLKSYEKYKSDDSAYFQFPRESSHFFPSDLKLTCTVGSVSQSDIICREEQEK